MSQKTAIQWCDSTVNPVMGCSGCELWNDERKTCYAGQLHKLRSKHKGFSPDFDMPKLFPGRMAEAARWSDLTGTERPEKPWLNGLPRTIFVSDMGDALSEKDAIDADNQELGSGVPFEFLKSEIVDAAMSVSGKRHFWLWLTKRPRRLAEFTIYLQQEFDLLLPENIWIATSLTSKASLPRIGQLLAAGHEKTLRFLSVEPLWEEVSLAGRFDGIGWVIVGGESRQGSPAREFQCDWGRRLRDDCVEAAVPFFVKQLGSNVSNDGQKLQFSDSHGGDWNEWPNDLRVRQMPQASQCHRSAFNPERKSS